MPTYAEPRRPTEVARMEMVALAGATGLTLLEVFQRCCERTAETIGVERVGVWVFVDHRSAIRCANVFERSKNEHLAGAVLRVADFPAYFAALQVRKAVPAEVAASDPHSAELNEAYLLPLGITSMLDASIFVEAEAFGVLCLEAVGPVHEWTTEARDFAGSMADLLALRIGSAERTELRALCRAQEERLVALDKAESLAQLAAGVAHDFRNLLSVVRGHAELLGGRSDLPTDAGESVSAIATAAHRGTDLVSELLEFARPSGRPPTVLNLAEVTAEFLPALQAAVGRGHRIDFNRHSTVGQVLVNRSDFTRVLLNLVTNARDAMSGGGLIGVRIRPIKAAESPGHEEHFVMLEVEDRGAGMDVETLHRAFDSFFTTKAKGTGLGLPIVRRLTDRAGGFVRIESATGKGTTVRCFYPRVGGSSGATTEFAIPPELRTPTAE